MGKARDEILDGDAAAPIQGVARRKNIDSKSQETERLDGPRAGRRRHSRSFTIGGIAGGRSTAPVQRIGAQVQEICCGGAVFRYIWMSAQGFSSARSVSDRHKRLARARQMRGGVAAVLERGHVGRPVEKKIDRARLINRRRRMVALVWGAHRRG